MTIFHRTYFLLTIAVVLGLHIYCLIKNPVVALLLTPVPIGFIIVCIITGFGLWGNLLPECPQWAETKKTQDKDGTNAAIGEDFSRTDAPPRESYSRTDAPREVLNKTNAPHREVFNHKHKWYEKLFAFVPAALGAAGIILYFTADLPPQLKTVLPVAGPLCFFCGAILFSNTIFSDEFAQHRIFPILFGLNFTICGVSFPFIIMNDLNAHGADMDSIFDFFAAKPAATVLFGFAMVGFYLLLLGSLNILGIGIFRTADKIPEPAGTESFEK
jgi:hypothetical protein